MSSFSLRLKKLFDDWTPQYKLNTIALMYSGTENSVEPKTNALINWLFRGPLKEKERINDNNNKILIDLSDTIIILSHQEIQDNDRNNRNLTSDFPIGFRRIKILCSENTMDIISNLITSTSKKGWEENTFRGTQEGKYIITEGTFPIYVSIEKSDIRNTGLVHYLDEITARGLSDVFLGILKKETHNSIHGTFFTDWVLSLPSEKVINSAPFLSFVMTQKDDEEIVNIERSSIMSILLMRKLVSKVEDIIEDGTEETHTGITESVLRSLEDHSIIEKWTKKYNWIDRSLIEASYALVLSSTFNFRIDQKTTDELLKTGCVVLSIGARFNDYFTNVTRTIFVDPGRKEKNVYKFLHNCFDALLKGIEESDENLTAQRIYGLCHDYIASRVSNELTKEILESFSQDVGYAVGLEVRDGCMLINMKNKRKIAPGSVLHISIGVELKKEDGQPFAVHIGDTILITRSEEVPHWKVSNLTGKVSSSTDQIIYYLEKEEDQSENDSDINNKNNNNNKRGRSPDTIIETEQIKQIKKQKTSNSNHSDSKESKEFNQIKKKITLRATHEAEVDRKRVTDGLMKLREQKMEEIQSRFESSKAQKGESITKKEKHIMYPYSSIDDFPSTSASDNMNILIDNKNDSVLLPINFRWIPFHVSTIKNVIRPTDETGKVIIRIIFNQPPNVQRAINISPSNDEIKQITNNENNEIEELKLKLKLKLKTTIQMYIKELTYQSEDGKNLLQVSRFIKDTQKKLKEKDDEINESVSLNEKLRLIQNIKIVLKDVLCKPTHHAVGKQKGLGNLEMHQNGFRFTSRGSSFHILFSSINHAIFQPCERDQYVILHFNLKYPMTVGKKKTMDVQFYTEVRSASDDISGKRKTGFDPDEIMEEQREREIIAKTNSIFKEFVTQVEDYTEKCIDNSEEMIEPLEFDLPYRHLGFTGNPAKSNVDIFPCKECLVSLNEWPSFVMSLNNVDIAYFERVTFGLKSFDIAFVNKDLTIPPRISSIPTKYIEQIKEWLLEIQVPWYEGPTNMNWGNIIKEILKNPSDFAKFGGWEGWFGSDGGESDDSEDADSNFSDGSDSSASASEDDSEDVSVYSEEEDDEDDEEEDVGSDESEGMDWDELEKRAHESDKKRDRRNSIC